MKLEVLVTTMHQKDISKYISMNLQTDAVIANQADRENFEILGFLIFSIFLSLNVFLHKNNIDFYILRQ